MSIKDEQPDDTDEAQLAWLLTSACIAPELRRDFRNAMSARLDAEFAALGEPSRVGQLLAPSTNGHHLNGHAANGQHAAASNTAPTSVVAMQRPRRRQRWIGIAAAASLLVALAVWSDPPAWANMIRAIVESIEAFTLGRGGGEAAESVAADVGVAADEQPGGVPPVESLTIVDELRTLDVVPPFEAAKPKAEPQASASVPIPATEKPAWTPFDEPLAASELTERIDEQLAAQWEAQKIYPVEPGGDAEFMRRVYLDLTGRVPTVSEAREFLADQSPDRREQLVDRLLAHHDHATHFAAVWRDILLPAEVDLSRFGGSAQFEKWLAEKFAANVPYDEIVRELLLAEGRVSESGPLLFYAAVRLNPEELAARTSRAFLGVRMECAQCHDHPFDEVTQHDFWSFAAFFARISRPKGKMEMTSPVLAVRDNARGDVMIPESDEVVPPRLPLSGVEVADEMEGPSRREQLVDWLTSENNGQFARATVNRVWAHLFGRGLVEPVDDMRPANAAIAPEVLETLSRDFAASGFDLHRLCRALVLTEAYQRTSQAEVSDPSRTISFAQMNIKSFTAEQLYDCIAVATGQAMSSGAANQPGLVRSEDSTRQAFIEQFRAPAGQATDYQAGIPQALTMMHGGLIDNATDVASSGILKSLSAPFFTDESRLDTLFLSTLSRYPEPEERELLLAQIAAAANDAERQQVLGDVLWALLNSAEFTLNH